jgi:hypothetical protein
VKRTLDFGKRVNLDYDGSALRGFFSDHWLDLSAMGRPDEELAAIFERYGEKYVPEAIPANDRGRIEDGQMTVTSEYPVYDYGTIQAAIRQARDDYLAAGEHSIPAGSSVKLILENRTGGPMNHGDVVLQALRDGQWMWISSYAGYGSTLSSVEIPEEGTAEAWLRLPMYDDPLTPGRYRAAVYYGVPDDSGLLDMYFERVAYAEFEIAEGVPDTASEDDGTELLLWKADRERVESIRYELPRWGETYDLYKGSEGFEEALDILFSLRGKRCEKPEVLTSRIVDLDPRIELAYDGTYVYGATNNGARWMRLEGEERPDRALGAVFERWAQHPDPIGEAADHSKWTEDSRLIAFTEREVYDLSALLDAIAESREAYEAYGEREYSRDAAIHLTIENHLDEPLYYGGGSWTLEILLDGQWRRWREYSRSYFLIAFDLAPGEEMTVPMPMECFVRPLTAGRYRFVFTCDVGELGGAKYVACAEFELTDGGVPLFTPEPTPGPTPGPTPEASDPEAIGTTGCYWIARMSDGADRLATGERAAELDRLIGDAMQNGEEEWQSDFSSSEHILLDRYAYAEDGTVSSLGPAYYELYADEFCFHGMSPYASYAEKIRLPAGSFQAVFNFVSGLPALDEALAGCVRGRPSGGDGTYSYDLFDLEGNYVQGVGPYGDPLEIGFTDSLFRMLIVLRGSAGPERSAKWSVYYDPIGGVLSEAYDNVLMETPEMILCGELDSVRIFAPISGELLGTIAAFSEPLAPTADSPFLSAGYTEDGTLSVTYLAGEDYREVTDRYELTSTSSQWYEFTLLPAPEP